MSLILEAQIQDRPHSKHSIDIKWANQNNEPGNTTVGTSTTNREHQQEDREETEEQKEEVDWNTVQPRRRWPDLWQGNQTRTILIQEKKMIAKSYW